MTAPVSARHRAAEQTLARLNLFADLAPFHPALTGTIPLGIDLPGSDLDIVCEAHDLPAFAARLELLYGDRPQFSLAYQQANSLPVVLCRFLADEFPIEIFGQPRPVPEQNAWRHMLAEKRLLDIGGEAAYQEVPHVHVHLFPRFPNDGQFRIYDTLPSPAPRSELDALAATIRRQVAEPNSQTA